MARATPRTPNGHKTSYLWEQVWARDAWLDILHRFIQVERPSKGSISARRAAEIVIFPRFHQWDAVLKLEADATANGAGQTYLIQHSAGSGKSNTIAWTAHRLSTLHDAEDHKVFDKVVVITDRVILDQQLQDTIYQFEHARGVVVKIDKDSAQLAEALAGEEARIIITTLQKFPFVLDKIGTLPARNYAIVIDEAHSSQSGEAAKDLRVALGAADEQELTAAEAEDAGLFADADRSGRGGARQVGGRAQRTPAEPLLLRVHRDPKGRTLEMFGQLNPQTNVHEPFHLYSMRQAIEEGFIMDVLSELHDLPDLLEDREGDQRGPGVRREEGPPGDRPVREPAPLPPGAEGRDHRRALPQPHRQADGRPGQGDGGDLIAAPRRPLQAEHRQVHQAPRDTTISVHWSRSPGRSMTALGHR